MKLYDDIRRRTGGNIYLGVTGPVRTGKSTFVKRLMETMVLPNIRDEYRLERAKDELPQSGSGKTIMTAEPKFVPEQAVEISPDGKTKLSVRLIDSVGYMVPGAVGAEEDGSVRMVTTPWFDHEIPFPEAAELGTKKVMEQHAAAGVVVTTDGSVTDLPREAYADAESRAVEDMRAAGKPFVLLLNTAEPGSDAAKTLAASLGEQYGVFCLPVNCLTMGREDVAAMFRGLLGEFGLGQLQFRFPGWLEALEPESELKQELYEKILDLAKGIERLSQAEPILQTLEELPQVSACSVTDVDLGTGTVNCTLTPPESLFYELLSRRSGVPIRDDSALLELLTSFGQIRTEYERLAPALEQVRASGYGIVQPAMEQMKLHTPELIKKGGAYGLRLRADVPAIHLLRTDLTAELSPMVGSERQAEDLAERLLEACEGEDPEVLRENKIFGRSLYEMLTDSLNAKLVGMPDDSRRKLRDALTRIANEGARGLICLIL